MVEQVAFAEELLQDYLLDAAAELQTLCSSEDAVSNGRSNGAVHERKRVRSLLLRMEGVVIGARTCLPDFEHGTLPGAPSCIASDGLATLRRTHRGLLQRHLVVMT